jgi:hypothetical protein
VIYYIIDNGMDYSDHGMFFISVPEEYGHLDSDLRIVLPYLVSGESEDPSRPYEGKHLVMVARAAEVVREGHGHFWITLKEAIWNWPKSGNLTKRVKNLIEVEGGILGKKSYRYGKPHELTVPVDDDVQAAADRLMDALPADWFR